jgi:hypothetical protein
MQLASKKVRTDTYFLRFLPLPGESKESYQNTATEVGEKTATPVRIQKEPKS